jgi:ferredoxin
MRFRYASDRKQIISNANRRARQEVSCCVVRLAISSYHGGHLSVTSIHCIAWRNDNRAGRVPVLPRTHPRHDTGQEPPERPSEVSRSPPLNSASIRDDRTRERGIAPVALSCRRCRRCRDSCPARNEEHRQSGSPPANRESPARNHRHGIRSQVATRDTT